MSVSVPVLVPSLVSSASSAPAPSSSTSAQTQQNIALANNHANFSASMSSLPSIDHHHAHSHSHSHSHLHHVHPPSVHYPTSADSYTVFCEIGVGAFASVYKGRVKATGEDVAIKVIDLEQFNTNWDEVRNEISIMSSLHHPNVVRILASFVDGADLWIVMPLLNAGSCASIIKLLHPNGIKDEAIIATILKEVLIGLAYFHKDGKIHRDLKAGNILISSEGEVVLSDFGVAGTLMENGDRKRARKTFTGTPCWMAPEVMEHNSSGYDEKADIWSLGITAMELGYGRAPYAKFQPMKVMLLTLQEDPPTVEIYKDHSYEFSKHFFSLIEKCLRKDPAKRPNAKKLLEHKFFSKAKDRQYLIDKIVKKLPNKFSSVERSLCGGGGEGAGINISSSSRDNAALLEHRDKNKPVSVGSWVFDKEEYEEFKRRAANQQDDDTAHQQRTSSVQASYANDTDDHHVGVQGAGGVACALPTSPFSCSSASTSPRSPRGGLPSFQPIEQSAAHSPTEHREEHVEGRFLVSEEEDDHQTNEAVDEQCPVFHAASSVNALDQPVNVCMQQLNMNSQHTSGTPAASQHIGRFAVLDDQDDQEN